MIGQTVAKTSNQTHNEESHPENTVLYPRLAPHRVGSRGTAGGILGRNWSWWRSCTAWPPFWYYFVMLDAAHLPVLLRFLPTFLFLSLRFTFAIPSLHLRYPSATPPLHLRYFFATDLFHSRLQINGAWDVYTFEKNRRMNVD